MSNKKRLGFTFYYQDWLFEDELFKLDLATEMLYFHIISGCFLAENQLKYQFFSKILANRKLTKRTLDAKLDTLIAMNLVQFDGTHYSCKSVAKRLALAEAGRKAGLKSAEIRSTNRSTLPPTNRSRKEKEKEKEKEKGVRKNANASFLSFLEVFKKQPKDFSKAENLYLNLTESDQHRIKEHLPSYLEETQDIKYRLLPENYIEKRKFDEHTQTQEKVIPKMILDPNTGKLIPKK